MEVGHDRTAHTGGENRSQQPGPVEEPPTWSGSSLGGNSPRTAVPQGTVSKRTKQEQSEEETETQKQQQTLSSPLSPEQVQVKNKAQF